MPPIGRGNPSGFAHDTLLYNTQEQARAKGRHGSKTPAEGQHRQNYCTTALPVILYRVSLLRFHFPVHAHMYARSIYCTYLGLGALDGSRRSRLLCWSEHRRHSGQHRLPVDVDVERFSLVLAEESSTITNQSSRREEKRARNKHSVRRRISISHWHQGVGRHEKRLNISK